LTLYSYTPLYSACRRGSVELVHALLAHGAEVNARVANDERVALHTATVNGCIDITNLLIGAGAEVTSPIPTPRPKL